MTVALDEHGTRLREIDGIAAVTAVRLIGRTGIASRFASEHAFATLRRGRHQIAAWHLSNASTEAANNLIKRVNCVGFGFTRFRTTESACCSTPADPTGTYSRPSLPGEIRRADNDRYVWPFSLFWQLTLLIKATKT